jgi:hypothetical protein
LYLYEKVAAGGETSVSFTQTSGSSVAYFQEVAGLTSADVAVTINGGTGDADIGSGSAGATTGAQDWVFAASCQRDVTPLLHCFTNTAVPSETQVSSSGSGGYETTLGIGTLRTLIPSGGTLKTTANWSAGVSGSQPLVLVAGYKTLVGNGVPTQRPFPAPIFNVKTGYGAAGDGSTDDRTSIQNALTAASGTGGTVYFPPGTYQISNWIAYGGDCTIAGDSASTTTIRTTLGRVDDTPMLTNGGSAISNITVRGLTWDQRADVYDASADSMSAWLMNCWATTNMRVEDCDFRNVRTIGLYFDTGSGPVRPVRKFQALRCHVYSARGDGISFFGDYIGVLAYGCIVEHSNDDAIALQTSVASTYSYSQVAYCQSLNCSTQTTYGSTPNGVNVWGGDHVYVDNNIITNIYANCLRLGADDHGRRATNIYARNNVVSGGGTNNLPSSGTFGYGVFMIQADGISGESSNTVSGNRDGDYVNYQGGCTGITGMP